MYVQMCVHICMCEHVQKKAYHAISPGMFLNRDGQGGIKTAWARQTDECPPSERAMEHVGLFQTMSCSAWARTGAWSVSASLQRGAGRMASQGRTCEGQRSDSQRTRM